MAVVDDEHEALLEVRGDLREPGLDPQADLADLAIDEGDSVLLQAGGKVVGRGFARELHQAA